MKVDEQFLYQILTAIATTVVPMIAAYIVGVVRERVGRLNKEKEADTKLRDMMSRSVRSLLHAEL